MAEGEHTGRSIKLKHPSHPHWLSYSGVLDIYRAYDGKWRCDVCARVFDGKRAPSSGPGRGKDREQPDSKTCYHCSNCKFDVCTSCFKGHLHSFHRHRLKKARATIVYREHEGLWHCDACKSLHSEHTEQLCYHCEKCEVDLCCTCFEGKWEHVLHSNTPDKHTLRPVDPSIEYITYQEWICDNCKKTFSCQRDKETAFHCDKCNFDLCTTCFSGEKHPFHPHPLVAMESGSQVLECSNCEQLIGGATHYRCRKSSCQYRLCLSCFSKQPEVHPYHDHPLSICDPLVVYPQSGGMWHCDRCTANSIHHRPVPLSHTETMYHCDLCEYDLCYSCHSEGQSRRFRPVQVTEEVGFTPAPPQTSDLTFNSSGYGTYQPYQQATYYTSHDYQTRLSRPLVTGLQSFIPQMPHRICVVCNRSEATSTFIHNGIPHSGKALCCDSCAFDVVSNRRPCPACRIPPDEIFRVPR